MRTVVERLTPVVAELLGRELPLGLRAWDGSRSGPPDPPAHAIYERA